MFTLIFAVISVFDASNLSERFVELVSGKDRKSDESNFCCGDRRGAPDPGTMLSSKAYAEAASRLGFDVKPLQRDAPGISGLGNCLGQNLTFRMIADVSHSTGRLIIVPFLIILLVIVSRSTYGLSCGS